MIWLKSRTWISRAKKSNLRLRNSFCFESYNYGMDFRPEATKALGVGEGLQKEYFTSIMTRENKHGLWQSCLLMRHRTKPSSMSPALSARELSITGQVVAKSHVLQLNGEDLQGEECWEPLEPFCQQEKTLLSALLPTVETQGSQSLPQGRQEWSQETQPSRCKESKP